MSVSSAACECLDGARLSWWNHWRYTHTYMCIEQLWACLSGAD